MSDVNAPNAKKQVQAREREAQAVKLRIAGYTLERIGEALGITHEGARKALKRALARTEEETTEQVSYLRELERQRLEWAMSAISPLVQKGNLTAIETYRKLSESLRRLMGLDAPVKAEVKSDEKLEITIRKASDAAGNSNQ